ncbi:hypothetical protein EYF80_026847 [Liparis tanakae]|uniref:Uncharacterized protein n=1 Tax=Liparis tanakae TaxID=230148 RepID=A0A4Z2HC90_9TELE|nr:hypothetical protein EYF80_026847 [Liparis tanakae]
MPPAAHRIYSVSCWLPKRECGGGGTSRAPGLGIKPSSIWEPSTRCRPHKRLSPQSSEERPAYTPHNLSAMPLIDVHIDVPGE